jgi:hypothetical protein
MFYHLVFLVFPGFFVTQVYIFPCFVYVIMVLMMVNNFDFYKNAN